MAWALRNQLLAPKASTSKARAGASAFPERSDCSGATSKPSEASAAMNQSSPVPSLFASHQTRQDSWRAAGIGRGPLATGQLFEAFLGVVIERRVTEEFDQGQRRRSIAPLPQAQGHPLTDDRGFRRQEGPELFVGPGPEDPIDAPEEVEDPLAISHAPDQGPHPIGHLITTSSDESV